MQMSNTVGHAQSSTTHDFVDTYPQGAVQQYPTKDKQHPLPTPPYTRADASFIGPEAMQKPSSTRTTPNANQSSPNSSGGTDVSTLQDAAVSGVKPKRTRTGCLTCRDRHLKCDEGMPVCQNCLKSKRSCKRGLRLNFIDMQCQTPPHLVPRTHDWKVSFEDESREIASEYEGGEERYMALSAGRKRRRLSSKPSDYEYKQVAAPVMSHQQLPQPPYPNYNNSAPAMYSNPAPQSYEDTPSTMSQPSMQPYDRSARPSFDQGMVAHHEHEPAPSPLTDPQEVLYMQVFVEEVGLWMDSMDREKHFSRLLPFQALRQPMLKYALLACGVRHLALVNPVYPEEHALNYYNQATQLLLKSLQNPNRDTVLCATTATVLNVYEVMAEKALQRMNHIAGARALIKECRWDARSTGIGAACFWLNVGMELFSCLHFNWGVAWDPEKWGIDMTMTPQHVGGNEEEWTHKVLWILAKTTNFRSTLPRFQDPTTHGEQIRRHQRYQTWTSLQHLLDEWDRCVPPTMRPMATVPTYAMKSKSTFPEVWYIKRSTIVARLFYHTAVGLLASVHPLKSNNDQLSQELADAQLHHARQICGITAHAKDRGIASASIRCLAVAGEFLTVRREQEEVLEIFDRIKSETGWRVAFINDELKERWGWNTSDFNNANAQSSFYQQGAAVMPTPEPAPRPRPLGGIVNPIYKNADFKAQHPPYEGSYVPPAEGYLSHNAQVYSYGGIPAI